MTTTVEQPKLDLNRKQEVHYAVPLWLRDEQIKQAIAKVKGRIEHYDPRSEPIAVVGYGPSLQDTWEKIRDFQFIISCSGSHRFLIDKGIIPTWHVEVDPREHKVPLLGEPHPNVEYLISSTCHPKYFSHLDGFNVKLWHVFDATEDGMRLLPPGEWAITGGCDVGLRAMTIAAFLGFRDLHIFGLDGCARAGTRHAGTHPHGKQPYALVEFEGVQYETTPAMLEAAKSIVHELKQMPKVRATFYGEGLTQRMARSYSPQETESSKSMANIVGFAKPELISATYREMNGRLHQENLAYGVGGAKYAEIVLKLADSIKTRSVLDYGCGKGYLAKNLPFPIWEYDPAISGKEESPRAADLVVCTDVLEHIEPDKLGFVLNDLRRVTKQVGYFVIHSGPSSKTLPDGRNTHLIQRNATWWAKQLKKFFMIGKIWKFPPLIHVIVGPKGAA